MLGPGYRDPFRSIRESADADSLSNLAGYGRYEVKRPGDRMRHPEEFGQ
jgi:hypothetical protein